MKKVLIVITTDFSNSGGLASVMLNYYRNMNKSNLIIDFASTNSCPKQLENELSNNESRYFKLGSRKKGIVFYLIHFTKLLKKEKYDILHVNGNSSTMTIELLIGKLCRIPVRIAHGHTTCSDYPILHKILNPIFQHTYTLGIAVSKHTGDWLFNGRPYRIFNNAIDVNIYAYSEYKRKQIRESLDIENKYVIGMVGKLTKNKNQLFLLRVFQKVKYEMDNAVLLLVGGGEMQQSLENEIIKMNLADDVVITGLVDDTSAYYSAIDIFAFTSKFEGFGMALLEAQAAGLYCLCSSAVPCETKLTENICYLSIDKGIDEWVDRILIYKDKNRIMQSKDSILSIRQKNYSIEFEAARLAELYMEEN